MGYSIENFMGGVYKARVCNYLGKALAMDKWSGPSIGILLDIEENKV